MENIYPLLGDKFPQISVSTTQGMKTIPDDYIGKWLVFFSHPGDFTPVCTTEFIEFAMHIDNFNNLNTALIGLSIDQNTSHIKWLEWIKIKTKVEIPFPLIEDPLGNISRKLGMISPAKGSNTVRSVFIIDDKGIIRSIFIYPQEIGRNINEIIRTIKSLQLSDNYQVVIPANWPYNSLIGDKVLLRPPTNIDDAKTRMEKVQMEGYTCYDWWFCFKSLS